MRNLKAKQLPSGNYRTQVIAGYDEKGKRIVKSFTADTEQESLRLAWEYKSDKDQRAACAEFPDRQGCPRRWHRHAVLHPVRRRLCLYDVRIGQHPGLRHAQIP